jgi:SAM-dependent methyltransferase
MARGPAPPLGALLHEQTETMHTLAEQLARKEILRNPRRSNSPPQPMSLGWYRELEQIRHTRQGSWIPALLEFNKHQGDRVLGLGVGLGSDLVQFAANGAEVVAVCSNAEQIPLVKQNFELRGLKASFLQASPQALPLDSGSVDVVCLFELLHEMHDPAVVAEEIYRVLKPGGKLLAIQPAHYDIHYWTRLFLLPGERDPYRPNRRFTVSELRKVFHRFHELRFCRRHLRRSDMPHLWRWLPPGLLERLFGRFIVCKGYKPISAAHLEQIAA